ncbi:tyrosine recombinase XerC [soil metagenome]
MSISKTASGRWRARITAGGVGVASRTFDLKRDAVDWETAQKRALAMGEFVSRSAGRESVAIAWERWQMGRVNSKSPTSLKADRAAYRLLPTAIRNSPIAAVRTAAFEAHYDQLLGRLTRASVLRYRNSYRAFFSWAGRQGMIQRNPASAAEVPPGRADLPSREPWPFSADELWSVCGALVEDAGELRANFALVLGLTGLRPGELVAMRVRDVQRYPGPAFRVTRSKTDDEPLRHTTKGGNGRTVPLVAEAWAVVEPLVTEGKPDDLLFPGRGGHFMTVDYWRIAVRWERHAMGRRLYDLRHTYATNCLLNGVNLLTLQKWMGHASISTTEKYLHLTGTDADALALSRLNAAAEVRRGRGGP